VSATDAERRDAARRARRAEPARLRARVDEIERRVAEALARKTPTPDPAPVCSTCDDTHMMALRDRDVMCTFCPLPCQACRTGGNGPFCSSTPCACECHRVVAREAAS
jgi:hypothetical protein